ncbi:roadblock/LC7 domain-containing protein [Desulfobacula sp.]|uniref:roadblock/LC7 domain-containing protein n=1 Tax=Desulfobacula sp. TaxID=2593537 RepID=UPI002623127D|nr:roadblock/LC7 domain-containing protein [Desulfobacula sp.]
MIPRKAFMQIATVTGVDQYIVVDHMGQIIAHDIKDPERSAGMVFACGRNAYAIGKTRLKYVLFPRENQKNFFIFPVGNYYLGVVKEHSIDNSVLTDNIMTFLTGLLKVRPQ